MVIIYKFREYEIFVGVDKFENEELIKYSTRYMKELGPEHKLVWFHADKFSSPHAYIRLKENEETIPENLIKICCQICKSGSIKGCKEPTIDIVYCYAENLSKAGCDSPGQVTYHDPSKCKYVKNVAKVNEIVKALEKGKGSKKLEDMIKEMEYMIVNKREAAKAAKREEAESKARAERKKKQDTEDMLANMTQAGCCDSDDFF